jgi:signal peptidase II
VRGRGAGLLYATAASVYLADRLTKVWAERTLADRGPIEVLPGLLSFHLTRNTGGAFSLGREFPPFFALATLAIALAIIVVSLRGHAPVVAIPLGSILGGAFGNFTDRVANGPGLSGAVTDFLDIRIIPVFNVADCGIVLGAIALVLATLRAAPVDG